MANAVLRLEAALSARRAALLPRELLADDTGRFSRLGFRETAPSLGLTVVCMVELERFASLRHTIGVAQSTRLMNVVVERLAIVLPYCQIGRVNRTSIEFVFAASDRQEAQRLLDDVLALIEQRIDLDGFRFSLAAMIGAVECVAGQLPEQSLDAAAAAVTEAQARHQKVLWADELTDLPTLGDLILMRDLPRAIANGELELHYQPKLRSRTNTIDCAEALLRWHHADHGPVPIERLIALAESTGAIRDLTEWVIARAVSDRSLLVDAGHEVILHVNISGMLLADREFASKALELVAVAPGGIGFEITETAVIDDPERALRNLRAFASSGIPIAIDDYGAGLSSLSYLKQLPASELKIDRMFIASLVESNRDPVIVRSTIDLAHALEMEVTAEGVDNPLALSLLRVMGCDLIQGYLIAAPMPFNELVTFLDRGIEPAALNPLPMGLTQVS